MMAQILHSSHPIPAPSKMTKSWVAALKNSESRDEEIVKLTKLPGGNGNSVLLQPEDIQNLEETWGHCLVGFFAGKFPGRDAIIKMCISWEVQFEIVPHLSGWIVFKFAHASDCDKVLAKGPYSIFGRMLILRPLPRGFAFDDDGFSTIPIWIQMYNLPLECWTKTGISRIASLIGDPIAMDINTAVKSRISYARVLVEFKPKGDILEYIAVSTPTGDTYDIKIKYENLPRYCKSCKELGHDMKNCLAVHTDISKKFQGKSTPLPHRHNDPGRGKGNENSKKQVLPNEAIENLGLKTSLATPSMVELNSWTKVPSARKDRHYVPSNTIIPGNAKGKEIVDEAPTPSLDILSDEEMLMEDEAAWKQIEDSKKESVRVGQSRGRSRGRSKVRLGPNDSSPGKGSLKNTVSDLQVHRSRSRPRKSTIPSRLDKDQLILAMEMQAVEATGTDKPTSRDGAEVYLSDSTLSCSCGYVQGKSRHKSNCEVFGRWPCDCSEKTAKGNIFHSLGCRNSTPFPDDTPLSLSEAESSEVQSKELGTIGMPTDQKTKQVLTNAEKNKLKKEKQKLKKSDAGEVPSGPSPPSML